MDEEKSFKYLQPEQYYSDLYDRFTVERCRWWEKRGVSKDWASIKKNKSKKSKIKKEFTVEVVIPTALYFIKGERYAKKAETIREWMERDGAKDELLASAQPPEVQCLKCGSDLIPNFRDLQNGWPDKKDRVLFMYDCPNGCLPRRAFFDDGKEYRPKPHLCPKCNHPLNHTNKKLKNKIITNYTCKHCGHKEKDELDLSVKKEKIDKNFVKDRERFCLTEEQGREYLQAQENLKELSNLLEETKEKGKIQQKLSKIKKLPIAGLQKFLAPALAKEGYTKLDFSKPEVDKNIIVQFMVQDSKDDRGEYDSRIQIQRLLKRRLINTNWRLMSEGVHYRLGILGGRLKGFESEEDLIKLTIQKK